MMDPVLAMRTLAAAIDAGESALTVADVDWSVFSPSFASTRASALLSDLPEAAGALEAAPSSGGSVGSGLRQQLMGTMVAERRQMVLDVVRAQAAQVLGHTSGQAIEPGRAFPDWASTH